MCLEIYESSSEERDPIIDSIGVWFDVDSFGISGDNFHNLKLLFLLGYFLLKLSKLNNFFKKFKLREVVSIQDKFHKKISLTTWDNFSIFNKEIEVM